MIKYLLKYRALSVAILVLTPLLAWFFCSEIGQFTIEKDQSTAQDYCEVVKVVKTEIGKNAVNELFKLKVENHFSDSIDAINIQRYSYNQLDIKHFYVPQKTDKIYLFNSTFLI